MASWNGLKSSEKKGGVSLIRCYSGRRACLHICEQVVDNAVRNIFFRKGEFE